MAKRTITLPSYKVIAPSEVRGDGDLCDCGVRRVCTWVLSKSLLSPTLQGKEDTLIFSLKHPGTTVYYFKAENVEQLKT